jgi:peptidoglycan/LPS O-acetylase OafA/YrhL
VARALLGLETALIGLVLGLPGTVLALMWLFTEHTVTHRNENLFFANPLTLAALPLGIMLAVGSERARRWLRGMWLLLAASGVVGLSAKILPMMDQDNWRIIALVLPISLGMAGASMLYETGTRRAAEPSRSAA